MRLTQKSLAIGLASAALLGSFDASAQTRSAPPAPQTSPARSFTTELAKASLVKDGVTQPTPAQLTAARNRIQAQRDSGMGWGQIANDLGLNLGAVVSAANHAQPPAKAKARQSHHKPPKTEQQRQKPTGTSRGDNNPGSGNGVGKGDGGQGGNGGRSK